MSTTISPMTSTLQGHTACRVLTIPLSMPDGSVRQQVYLVPFFGPIPAQTTVLTSLQQLQQFQAPAGPTLIPSSKPQKTGSVQIVSSIGTQRTVDSSGTMDKVDAKGATNENKVSGDSSAKSPSNPSAAIVEECSKTSEPLVDHESEEQTHVISNVQEVPVENIETAVVPQVPEVPTPTQTNITQSLEVEPSATPSSVTALAEEFPTLGGPRGNSDTQLSREESLHTSSESGESSQSDFKEWTKAYVYKTIKKLRVRADKTSASEEVGILEKDTYVHIVFVEGKKGRIVEPLNGWISMKKKKEPTMGQLFNNFEAPTVVLRNLNSSLKKEKDVINFLRSQDCRPTRCIWHKKDDFATVFFTKHKDASKLVRGKFVCNDTRVNAEWADNYTKTADL